MQGAGFGEGGLSVCRRAARAQRAAHGAQGAQASHHAPALPKRHVRPRVRDAQARRAGRRALPPLVQGRRPPHHVVGVGGRHHSACRRARARQAFPRAARSLADRRVRQRPVGGRAVRGARRDPREIRRADLRPRERGDDAPQVPAQEAGGGGRARAPREGRRARLDPVPRLRLRQGAGPPRPLVRPEQVGEARAHLSQAVRLPAARHRAQHPRGAAPLVQGQLAECTATATAPTARAIGAARLLVAEPAKPRWLGWRQRPSRSRECACKRSGGKQLHGWAHGLTVVLVRCRRWWSLVLAFSILSYRT
mmetsp:Transcript_13633/g.35416  ORF Transcript_13633/g.35416 Transcript_13633/m.35416 type:complete len:308 (+) Transcript_13633:351-1274(+)